MYKDSRSYKTSLSKSVQTAYYIKDIGLRNGSTCVMRTAGRDTRSVGGIVRQILTLSLPTAALTELSHTAVYKNMNGMNKTHV